MGGADGLQVVFRRSDRRLRIWPEKIRSGDPARGLRRRALRRGAAHFELDLGRDGADEALAFAGLVERSGARPADCAVAFGLDPFAAAARGPFPVDWSRSRRSPCRRGAGA